MYRSRHHSQDENIAVRSRNDRRAGRRVSDPAVPDEGRMSPELMYYEVSSTAAGPIFPKETEYRSRSPPPKTPISNQHKDVAKTKPSSRPRLSDTGLKFIHGVRPKDVGGCARFINANPSVLRETDSDQKYLSEATTAFENGDQCLARNCVLKGSMVTSCAKLSRSDIQRFFRRLEQGDNVTAKKFYSDCEGKEREIAYQVQSRAREQVRSHGDSVNLHISGLQQIKNQRPISDEGSNASTIKPLNLSSTAPLSRLGYQFVDIPESKYDECRKFLQHHSVKIDFTGDQLLKEAEQALEGGERRYARRCIQRSILLRKWQRTSDGGRYFRELQIEGSTEMKELLKDFDKVLRTLEENVFGKPSEGVRRANSPMPSLAERHHSAASQPSSGRKDARVPSESQGVPVEDQQKRPNKAIRDREAPALSLPDISRPTSRHAASLPDSSRLDARYQIQHASFYVFGRVFALMWHEAAHRLEQDVTYSVERARFGEPVFSYVRRMVVVKPGHGFCWCVPISTYGGRGLSKAGLTKKDVEAHAVIHVEGERPRLLPSEPTAHKRAITMLPASEDQHSNSPTRINFAKVYTIEYNAKSMDIGRISEKSLPLFKQYFEEQLKLE